MNYSALIGSPVEHSVSNYLFQYFAETQGLDYSHLKINVPEAGRLKSVFESMRELGFKGFNITLPHKMDAVSLLDSFDENVRACGAVNTVKISEKGFQGFNTDCYGAITTISKRLKPLETADKVLILGAGGAARAVLNELGKFTSNVWITNRDHNKAVNLMGRFHCLKEAIPFDQYAIAKILLQEDINYIINVTPVGMSPQSSVSLLEVETFDLLQSAFFFDKPRYFFDAIFNPLETKFLKLAKEHGAHVCGGLYWMIYQGVKAFEIWNDCHLDEGGVEAIYKKLSAKL